MRFSKYAGLVVLLSSLAASTYGSFEGAVQVAQPILVWSGESSVWLCRVPYLGHGLHPRDPANVIALTVAPNLVWCDGVAKNRNLAAVAGISFAVETAPDPHDQTPVTALRDTLRIVVSIGTPTETLNPSLEVILRATLWCGLQNTRQVWPKVRVVEYVVEDKSLSSLGGMYSIESMESSSAVRWDADLAESLKACKRILR
jgi:hypothetical protein